MEGPVNAAEATLVAAVQEEMSAIQQPLAK
jgi:hypothetical protein